MRARLALQSAGVTVELREILLRDKPRAFLDTSASATVPALRLADRIIDESLDVMVWALEQHDPDQLLTMPDVGWEIISTNDGLFKSALDHTKYASRYPDLNAETERQKASLILMDLEARIDENPWLFGTRATVADFAVLPFIRQFANIDREWFNAQPWPNLRAWLDRFLDSAAFDRIMQKYKPWSDGDPPIWFGAS